MPVNQRKKVDISEYAHAEVAKVQILKYLADHFLLPSVASNLVATHVQLERRERLHLGQEIEESCSGYLLQTQHVLLLLSVSRDTEWTPQCGSC
jgi:hypothetical protein